jgi:hypothetical protein
MATFCRSSVVSYNRSKNASMFRRDRSIRLLTAWLAVVVQLHIFLVLELHHHVVGVRLLRESARVGASWTRTQQAPAPAPLCPACQVARQGAVQPAVEGLALLPLRPVAAALPARPASIPIIFLLHSSGRDPPRG